MFVKEKWHRGKKIKAKKKLTQINRRIEDEASS
jgi:hypothetical protein